MGCSFKNASFSPGRCHPFAAFPKGDGSLEGGSKFRCHHGAAAAADDDDDDDDDGDDGDDDDDDDGYHNLKVI